MLARRIELRQRVMDAFARGWLGAQIQEITPEIAKMRFLTAAASVSGDTFFEASSIKRPMTLAVKKPARLAPPAPATMIGRGHWTGSARQPFSSIQISTALLSVMVE